MRIIHVYLQFESLPISLSVIGDLLLHISKIYSNNLTFFIIISQVFKHLISVQIPSKAYHLYIIFISNKFLNNNNNLMLILMCITPKRLTSIVQCRGLVQYQFCCSTGIILQHQGVSTWIRTCESAPASRQCV